MRARKCWLSTAVAATVVATGLNSGGGTASAGQDFQRPTAGSDGDSYYPQDGNGGYDVADYNLKVGYDPATRQLTGSERITACATQALSSFDLDFKGLTVDSVKVNGTMQEVQRLTETVAHRDLSGFFNAWVYGSGKPADEYLYPGGLKPAA
jgi:hypothetical protein